MLRLKILSAVLVYTFLFSSAAFGQATTPKVYEAPKETIDKIKEEGLKNSQVMQTLSYLTDVIGGRLTGSPSMKRANEWTRDQMTKWGMQNAKLESWGPFGRGWHSGFSVYSGHDRVRNANASFKSGQFRPHPGRRYETGLGNYGGICLSNGDDR